MKPHLSLSLILFCFIVFSCSSDSDEPAPEPDVTAPTVNFTIAGTSSSGSEPIVVSNKIEININAQDAGGIAKVEAFIDNQKVGEDTTSPFQIIVDVSGYTSKNALTKKFTDYTLKIIVTDTSGNTSSTEQIINIDNELPTIAEVSLQNNVILSGDTNPLTFAVSDNEGLFSVKTFINDDLLNDHTDEIYELNINTLDLSEGENQITIEALDLAQNKSVYEINFIVDNSGPEILLENIEDGQILDTAFLFSPLVEDAYSPVASFTAKLNGNTILESTSSEIGEVEIDSENLNVGQTTLELEAMDDLGNLTSISLTVQVFRKLFKAQLESGFFENSWFGFHILISEMDGSFISLETVDINDSELLIYAPGEFPIDKEYMVSFIAEEDQSGWIKTHMTTVQNVTRASFDEIRFEAPFGEQINQQSIPMTNFLGVENLIGRGHGFMSTMSPNLDELSIEQYGGNGYNPYSGLYIIGYELGDDPSYGYMRIETPLDPAFIIDKPDFIFENVNEGTVSFAANNLPNYDQHLYIWGYETSQDKDLNLSHLLHDSTYTFGPVGTEPYYYPTIFEKYEHHFRLNNYNTFREGLPENEYLIPNWTIDHLQNGNIVNVSKTGDGHTVGRLIVEIGTPNNSQLMALLYDSSTENPVYLPELPEELSNLDIYQTFQNRTYSVDYSELISFDTLPTYEDYLRSVISNYKEHTEAAPVMESLTNRNAFIFNNWSFKYQ